MQSKSTRLLTPSQAKCKRPRIVNYTDDKDKQQLARDIIVLYVYCGLGYSPIRHILNLPNDKLIEDVVRQHMIGRNKTDDSNGELFCPQSKHLAQYQIDVISFISKKYDTLEDEYVASMMSTRTWSDDPAYSPRPKVCRNCSEPLDPKWICCPFCNTLI